ncbi:predicted protein [Arabidopsis lyrata subsp. lyrata]|uniref:Predicted protein n=1 Tax=Arabidopsis lyrata subsp. lyrata TaxID=81972 RepID=D7MGT4_ARALL|nr:predicted protein [Arabidopsis lyrata subsp. lyrata]
MIWRVYKFDFEEANSICAPIKVKGCGDGHEAIDDDDDDAAASSHMELDSAVTNDDGDVRVSESEDRSKMVS